MLVISIKHIVRANQNLCIPLIVFISTFFQNDIDALIKCVSKNIGFINGKPVAAFTIYKCLIHWKSFESERTSVFDRLIQLIGSEIEVVCFMMDLFITSFCKKNLYVFVTFNFLNRIRKVMII